MSSRFQVDSALLVNRTAGEVRIALVEGGRPTAFHIERERDRGIVGNIYKGRVVRVVPGMQSAFVEVGLDRSAFLHVADIVPQVEGPSAAVREDINEASQATDLGTALGMAMAQTESGQSSSEGDVSGGPTWADGARIDWPNAPGGRQPWQPGMKPSDILGDDDDDDDQDAETTHIPVGPDRATRRKARVENVLRSGQEIVVQVRKEALGKKGPRLTTDLSIPGRFLVYVPYGLHVGVSRRITSEAERERLRSLIEEHRHPGEGFIVRTACEGRDEDVLAADVGYLRELWREVRGRIDNSTAPRLLHEELDLVLRATRDLVSTEVNRVVVDDPGDHQRVSDFMKTFMPKFQGKLQLYSESAPLFEATGIEPQLGRALTRRIPLPSGGYLVLEHTEALTAIDVNTGRYVGGKNLEETTTKVNLEAVEAVVYQLRLRDIGGLIVVDFIDMEDPRNRARVEAALDEALESDPARSSVLPISEFGLVEMTRRRVRDDLAGNLQSNCLLCDGVGRLKSLETVAYEVLREAARHANSSARGEKELTVRCESGVAQQLLRREKDSLDRLARRLGGPVQIQAEESFRRDRFTVSYQVTSPDTGELDEDPEAGSHPVGLDVEGGG